MEHDCEGKLDAIGYHVFHDAVSLTGIRRMKW
jgi:hypothetical protein